jgi:hypothetical protein
VYDTERAWAYAMELKQESTNSLETRKHHHLTKRLKRAAQHAEKLVTLCEQNTVDARTVLDAKVKRKKQQDIDRKPSFVLTQCRGRRPMLPL